MTFLTWPQESVRPSWEVWGKNYKANKFRTFFYFGTEEEGEKKYEQYMAN